jgi:hypothetical protein
VVVRLSSPAEVLPLALAWFDRRQAITVKRRCLERACLVLIDAPARRCAGHEREFQRARNRRRLWDRGDWPARARRPIEAVPYCQCLGCDAHGAGPCGSRERLGADHVRPRDPHGALATLCAICNGSKGGRQS